MQMIKDKKWWEITCLIFLLTLVLFTRFAYLNISPPSPYWEEVALGYDAYSISKTLRDHHGHFLPLVAFESFGDFKPSLYFYVLVPFIKAMGLSVLTVRLPTILASIAIIFGTALLAKTLSLHFYYKNRFKIANYIFYLALFLSTISPWLLTFSRSAWESTLATALVVWGVNFWLFFIATNLGKWAVLSTLLLSLSTYAYHANRVSAPLLGIALLIFYFWRKKSKLNYKALIISGLTAFFVFSPIALALFDKSGQQRIAETSIFNDLAIIQESNQQIEINGETFWSKILYHRYLFFTREVLENFISHFRFDYLFVNGDANPRHSIQTFGQFYYLDAIFFIFALIFLFRQKKSINLLLIFYLIFMILPAAFTKAVPHALRTLSALPVFIIFLSFGIWQVLSLIKKQHLKIYLIGIIIFIYSFYFSKFFYQLIFIYPEKYKQEWQFGYEEMVKKVFAVRNNYEKIYISREQGRPAMYYFFYNQIDPSTVQSFAKIAKKDQGEFLNFDNLEFVNKFDQLTDQKNSLLVRLNKDKTWEFYEVK